MNTCIFYPFLPIALPSTAAPSTTSEFRTTPPASTMDPTMDTNVTDLDMDMYTEITDLGEATELTSFPEQRWFECVEECLDGYFAMEENHTCVTDCGDGYYGNVTSGECVDCAAVINNCLVCSPENQSESDLVCTQCLEDHFWLEGDCVEECPSNHVIRNRTTGGGQMECVSVSPCSPDGDLFVVCIAVPVGGAVLIAGLAVGLICFFKKRKSDPRPQSHFPSSRRPSIPPSVHELRAAEVNPELMVIYHIVICIVKFYAFSNVYIWSLDNV